MSLPCPSSPTGKVEGPWRNTQEEAYTLRIHRHNGNVVGGWVHAKVVWWKGSVVSLKVFCVCANAKARSNVHRKCRGSGGGGGGVWVLGRVGVWGGCTARGGAACVREGVEVP